MLPPVAALRSSLDLLFRWIAWLYSIDADILRIDRQKAYPIPFHRHETHVWIRTASTHLPSHRSSSDGNSTHGGVRPTETSESAAPRPEPRATRSFATMSTGIAKGRIPSVQHHCHASCSAAMTARRAHTIHKATGHDLAAHGTTQGGVPCHANATRVLPMGRGARGKTDHKRGHTSLVENDTTCCKAIERGVRLVAYSKAVNPAAHGLAGGLARPSAVTSASASNHMTCCRRHVWNRLFARIYWCYLDAQSSMTGHWYASQQPGFVHAGLSYNHCIPVLLCEHAKRLDREDELVIRV